MAIGDVALLATVALGSTFLTIPYIVRVFREDFDSGLWGNWFRLATYLLTLGSILLSMPLICLSSLWLTLFSSIILAFSCLGIVYNVLFGLRLPQIGICAEDLSVCMESSHCGVNLT